MFELYVLPVLIFLGLALVAGLLLSFAASYFAVKEDNRIIEIREALPGVNCGACGYKSCDDYANAVVNDGAAISLCRPGRKKTEDKIAEILNESAD